MTTQENLKPLIDRILSNPLHFKLAVNKKSSPVVSSELLKKSSYIVIKANSNSSNKQRNSSNKKKEANLVDPSDMSNRTEVKKVALPKSMAEAIALYTSNSKGKKTKNGKKTVDNDVVEKEPVQADALESTSSSDDSDVVYHEAKEYIEFDGSTKDITDSKEIEDDDMGSNEDIGEDLGEDLGELLDSKDSINIKIASKESSASSVGKTSSSAEDQEAAVEEDDDGDFDLENNDNDENSESNEEDSDSNESEPSGNISETEKAQLQEESREYESERNKAAHLKNLEITMKDRPLQYRNIENDDEDDEKEEENESELKHKLPESKRSVTPPSTIADIDKFYKFNEEITDEGSILPSHILKSWGPELSELKPRGLLNHGVTCYTNAAVQSMLHIPAVQHYLFDILDGKYSETISPNSVSNTLAETSRKMWLASDRFKKKNVNFIDPKRLIASLDEINCMMSEWQQEDSHEYFMSLMSRLQEDSVPKGHKMTESIIYDIFGGLLKQCVTCKSCGEVSKTEQPFYDLSLHLKGKKKTDTVASQSGINSNSSSNNNDNECNSKTTASDGSENPSNDNNTSNNNELSQSQDDNGLPSRRFSIEKSIKDFFNPELIKVDSEKKGYVCEKCHKTTNAIKHNTILRAPETLLIHLKKFRFNGTSSSKMKQAVSYPMFLDLSDHCDTENLPRGKKLLPVKYQLISVIVHEGRSLSSGHYVAHCKQPNGSWANYDDEYINNMTERDVLREPNAYYLVYTRLTPKAINLKKTLPIDRNIGLPGQTKAASETNANKNKNNNNKNNASTKSSNNNNNNKNWKNNKNKKRRFNKY